MDGGKNASDYVGNHLSRHRSFNMRVHKRGANLDYVMGLRTGVRDDDIVTHNSVKRHIFVMRWQHAGRCYTAGEQNRHDSCLLGCRNVVGKHIFNRHSNTI